MAITPARISVLSTEFVVSTITIMIGNISVPINPTSDVVKVAFMPADVEGGALNPSTGDWKAASWYSPPGPPYVIQCLVGPNGVIQLGIGRYFMWTQIVDNLETIIQKLPGFLTVY